MGKFFTLDVSGIKQAIKEMDLYPETTIVIEQYNQEKALLDQRKKDFEEHIVSLQKALADNMLARETYKHDKSLYINLSIEYKTIQSELEVMASLLEEVEEEYKELKLRFVPMFQEARRKEFNGSYSVTEDIGEVKYLMLTAIAELANEMTRQHREVEETLMNVMNDETVQEKLKPRKVHYGDGPKPIFNHLGKSVIGKEECFAATSGYVQMLKPLSLKEAEKEVTEGEE